MTTGRILIKFWRGNLYPQERLRERLQRARTQHGYRFTDDEKNRDGELGHWFYGEDRELCAEIKRQLCVFAGGGRESLMRALRPDDAGKTKSCTRAPASDLRRPAFWLASGLIFCG